MHEMLQFIGDGTRHTTTPHPEAPRKPEPYVAESSLVNAVNMALQLRRPLLLEGDPGCGKTRLAYAVAYELGYPLKECYIRSTSQARDLLYTYDALRRLYDVQMAVAQYGKKEAFLKIASLMCHLKILRLNSSLKSMWPWVHWVRPFSRQPLVSHLWY